MEEMTRRRLLGAGVPAVLTSRAGMASPDRPNILFIQTDDQRYDDMSCAGNRILRTPNLDRLAAEGTLFENAFVTTAICCCSRASVLTGQHMRRHGIRDFEKSLPAEALEATYPVLLRQSGYRTAFLGKFAVGDTIKLWAPEHGTVDARGESPGTRTPSLSLPSDRFDFWFGFPQRIDFLQKFDGQERHLTPLMVEKAIEFFRSAPANQPFCMSLNLKEPHGPLNFFDPDRPDLYKDADIPEPATHTKADFEAQPEFLRRSLNGNQDGRWPDDARERLLKGTRTWFRLISDADHAVGRVMAELRQLGRDQNTVVIFTSDHGSMRGAHGLSGKWLMNEESIRVPLIIRDPRLPASLRGARRREMALNIDLAPTMLRLGGVTAPSRMQGRDLVPLLNGRAGKWRPDWFYEHTFTPKDGRLPIAASEGVRSEGWKYIRYTGRQPVFEQLFDLAKDPVERHNLAGDNRHRKTLARMRARWQELRREAE